MEYTTLIQDYFDGVLDDSQVSGLFYEAASNERVRSEFKSFLTMEVAYRKDSNRLIPSAKSTVNVFSRIGFPGYINSELSPNIQPLKKDMTFFKKYSHSIFSGITSSVITALIFILLYHPYGNVNIEKGISSNSMNTNIQFPKNSQLEIQRNLNDIIPNKSNPKMKNHNGNSIIIKQTALSNGVKIADNSKYAISDEENNLKLITENNSLPFLSISKIAKPILLTFNKTGINLNKDSFIKNEQNLPDLSMGNSLGIGIELRGLQDWSLDKPTLPESSLPKFNNSGITIFYSLSDNFMIGIDARQEYFYQEFTGTDDFGDRLIYRQFPNLVSYGVAFKYKLFKIENLTPFSQIIIGGNKAGYVGRAQLGLESTPAINYTFFIGCEYGLFDYFHDNTRFYSSKIGLNYGVRINF